MGRIVKINPSLFKNITIKKWLNIIQNLLISYASYYNYRSGISRGCTADTFDNLTSYPAATLAKTEAILQINNSTVEHLCELEFISTLLSFELLHKFVELESSFNHSLSKPVYRKDLLIKVIVSTKNASSYEYNKQYRCTEETQPVSCHTVTITQLFT